MLNRLALMAVLCGLACSTPREEAPSASAGASREPTREACANRDPLKHAFFGDLHVHTAYSMDANMFGTRGTPDDAYRFARGYGLTPTIDGPDGPARTVQLERPLDFAAVTDHAENLGEVALCTRPGSPVYASASCRIYRGEGPISLRGSFKQTVQAVMRRSGAATSEEVCGPDRERCIAAVRTPWMETREAAERWQDRSAACAFTAFPAYEFSWTPEASKIHRNVIFRSHVVPEHPLSAVDVPHPRDLWRHLKRTCIDAGTGCDVLAIPHNSNLSDGRMFAVEYGDAQGLAEEAEYARLRAQLEPLVEIMQVKGDSECRNGLFGVAGAPDEQCGWEKTRDLPETPPDCREVPGSGALAGGGCTARLDFARYALIEGMKEAARTGVNPYAFGIVAATDIHNATPGDVDEWAYDGIRRRPLAMRFNPGGLAGVWAEENSREALFDGMRSRETFGTSGPRIQPRFFAGWGLGPDACDAGDLVAKGYAGGVPMGSELAVSNATSNASSNEVGSPTFVAWAAADPGTEQHPGTPLQKLQLIKGWVGADGLSHQRVYDVAGDSDSKADVDLATCEPRGEGASTLCGVWQDPDFDPTQRAVYYVRVLENPTCRFNVRQCANEAAARRDPVCDDPRVPQTTQERAWTSPIWLVPRSTS